jgi:hypothetical protein
MFRFIFVYRAFCPVLQCCDFVLSGLFMLILLVHFFNISNICLYKQDLLENINARIHYHDMEERTVDALVRLNFVIKISLRKHSQWVKIGMIKYL